MAVVMSPGYSSEQSGHPRCGCESRSRSVWATTPSMSHHYQVGRQQGRKVKSRTRMMNVLLKIWNGSKLGFPCLLSFTENSFKEKNQKWGKRRTKNIKIFFQCIFCLVKKFMLHTNQGFNSSRQKGMHIPTALMERSCTFKFFYFNLLIFIL